MSGPKHEPEDPKVLEAAVDAGHEVDHVATRLILRGAIAFITITLIAVITVYVLQPLLVRTQKKENPPPNPLAATYGRVEPPAPRLQVDPSLDIHAHRKVEQRILDSYAWVDQKAGIVRIPIARAIDLLAERGLQATSGQGAAGAAAPPSGERP